MDMLKNAHESLHKDKEIVLTAIKQDGYILRFAHDSLCKSKVVLTAI